MKNKVRGHSLMISIQNWYTLKQLVMINGRGVSAVTSSEPYFRMTLQVNDHLKYIQKKQQ